MHSDVSCKLMHLKEILKETGGCAVAFSGGVDSTLLVTVAHEVLGDRCLAVTATSSTYPEREFKRAVDWIVKRGIPHMVVSSEELDIPGFSSNPPDRCYYCKKELFTILKEQADAHGLQWIADGTNADDVGDYRPGIRAACDLGVISPLREAGLTKNDIRLISREVYDLPTADRPAMACLASRFPYGSVITGEKLDQVEQLEAFLEREGFRVFRARHHGDILRLELGPEEMASMSDTRLRAQVTDYAKKLGFTYITLDLEGYRTGSMNEVLSGQTSDRTHSRS